MTFDVSSAVLVGQSYGWQHHYELFSVCRKCHRPTIFAVEQKDSVRGDVDPLKLPSINDLYKVKGFVALKDFVSQHPPEYLPEQIENAFREAATCLAVACYNAAGCARAWVEIG